jgi:7-carboxy-7-deazaguanine synthase
MLTATQEGPAKLRLTEIFYSLQGESRTVGLPTVFVRLTGCPLRCGYCDTAYAFDGGEWHSTDDILAQIARYRTRYVTVTGGEPLAQKSCLDLLKHLCDSGYEVSLETSGALDIQGVDHRVVIVMDLKTPGSGEQAKNLYDNLGHLKRSDQIKFVMCDENDYAWAKTMVVEHELARCCEVLFSPSHGQLDATQLADWILTDQLPVRMQVQLHKYLWGDVPGH